VLGSEFAGTATVTDGSGQLLRYSRVHADNSRSRARSCVDFALAHAGDQSVMLKRPAPELLLMCHHTSGSYGASCGTARTFTGIFKARASTDAV